MRPIADKLLLAALCLLPLGAQALGTDRNQPIDIHADRVNIDEKRGYSEYLGHVEMTQGSLRLEADRVLIYQRGGRLQKVQAHGDPARFSQLPDGRKTRIRAQAQSMEYDADSGQLVLSGQARVVQGANTFAGERIDYNTHNATVRASKGEHGQGRVHAIIEPATPTPPNQSDGGQDQRP